VELVSKITFEKRNILIFYVHEQDFDAKVQSIEKKIQEALDSLSEG
jgi:hypothetical protein